MCNHALVCGLGYSRTALEILVLNGIKGRVVLSNRTYMGYGEAKLYVGRLTSTYIESKCPQETTP
jgi:hypothetical protein